MVGFSNRSTSLDDGDSVPPSVTRWQMNRVEENEESTFDMPRARDYKLSGSGVAVIHQSGNNPAANSST